VQLRNTKFALKKMENDMKKLFAAVIASVAFVFGLASCQNEEVSLAELAYNSKSDQATV